MFRADLRSSGDETVNTPAATPAMGLSAAPETPGTTDVNSVGYPTPGYTPLSTSQGMTPSTAPGLGYKDQPGPYDGVEESNEDNGDEGDEELARDDEEQENEAIRNLSMTDFMPRSVSSLGKYGVSSESMIPGMFAPTPQQQETTPATAATAAAGGAATAPDTARDGGLDTVPATPAGASLAQSYGATMPVIHNVVATASLGCELNLKQVALTARNAEYNPRRFAAVIMRIRDPKSTALVFKSGKLVVTGTKSEADARLAARKFGRIIVKIGFTEARFTKFKVENLVATFKVPFPIHLEQLCHDCRQQSHVRAPSLSLYRTHAHLWSVPPSLYVCVCYFCCVQYEPEVFPGLIFRLTKEKQLLGTLLIFVSGKCVMIGMKNREAIQQAHQYILPILNKYRKK